MARGRPRKSAELHLHLGNPSKKSRKALERAVASEADVPAMSSRDDATADLSPQLPAGLQPPSWLEDAARRAWCEIVPLIAPSLKASDANVLARYCDVFARWLTARDELRDGRSKSGMRYTYKSKTRDGGNREYVRPHYRILKDAEGEMRALEAVLPLTPSSRAGILSRLSEMQDPVRPPVPRPAAAPSSASPSMPPASPIGILSLHNKPN